ncbi:MAG: class I SAM-dependent methyltransferase [Clostridia bacterium]|nr:class I SAM-dependent methyltransferase [Clostridia bacterium]
MLPFNQRNVFENHTSILNKLIISKGYKSYLEIGVNDPKDNYDFILAKEKEGCDPGKDFDYTYNMTSDEMFAQMDENKKYDLIFIDGMHTSEYSDRDITNAFKHLNKDGIICVHDTIPRSKEANLSYDEYHKDINGWNGDVWKSIVKLNCSGIQFFTLDCGDYGITIILYSPGCENINLNDYVINCTYENYFNDNNFLFGCLNLQGRYVMHAIDIFDFEKIFNISI